MKSELLVIKIGGNIINNSDVLKGFLSDLANLKKTIVLVHGGGNIATKMSEKLEAPTEFIDGRRITSKDNLDIVTMVYAGLINKNISATLQGLGCNAIGLCGSDANVITSVKRPAEPIDFGWVGDITKVDTDVMSMFLENKMTPVLSAIGHDGRGQLLNTNADTVASEIAIAMSQNYTTSLLYVFEKDGVLHDMENEDSVIENLNLNKYEKLLEEGVIHSGMLPKLTNCFYALKNKVHEVKIAGVGYLSSTKQIHTNITLEATK